MTAQKRIFTALRYAGVVYAVVVCVSVCTSICQSQAGIVSKRLDGWRWVLACELPLAYPKLYCEEIVT